MGQLSTDDKKDIKKSIALFDDVIKSYSDDAGRRSNATHLYNRGAARRLSGDVSGANLLHHRIAQLIHIFLVVST